MPNEHMPGGSFTACVSTMQDKGHSEDSAKKICGAIQAKVENNSQKFELDDKENEEMNKCMQEYTAKKFESLDNVDIFAVGKWNKDKYSAIDLQEMIQNFNALKDVVKPPAKIGHSEDQTLLKKEGLPAAGWVDKLKLVGDKVVASFKDVPKVIKDLIDKKAYKRVSAEIYPTYKNPVDGKIYKNVLRAVAFLGSDIPAVETLSDISALYSSKDTDGVEYKIYSFDLEKTKKGGGEIMGKFSVKIEGNDKEVLVKKLAEALGDSVKVNVEDQSVIDEEEKKKQEEEAENKKIKDKRIEELTQQYDAVHKLQGDKDKEISDLKTKIAELHKQLEGLTGEKSDMMTKISDYEKKFNEANVKLEESAKLAKSESIKSFVKQQITDGKVLPKDENIVVALMEQLDDKAVMKFSKEGKETTESTLEVIKKFISGMHKVVNFTEMSPHVEHKVYEDKVSIGGVQYDVENVELVQKAEKYAQDNNVTFDKALLEVSKTNNV